MTFLEEVIVERRHEEILPMPIAISIHHIREVIVECLAQKFPDDDKSRSIPSEEWIGLQFWPKNPFDHTALRHTGRFNVKFAV